MYQLLSPLARRLPGIKKYPGAKMGGHIFSLKPGDFLDVKGPILKIRPDPFGIPPNFIAMQPLPNIPTQRCNPP